MGGELKTQRTIGIVDWFYDEVRNAPYGFIKSCEYGDVFVHQSAFIRNTTRLQEGHIVVFLPQPSKLKSNQTEARNVYLLQEEKDISFLLEQFFAHPKGLSHQIHEEIKSQILRRWKEKENSKEREKISLVCQQFFEEWLAHITQNDELISYDRYESTFDLICSILAEKPTDFYIPIFHLFDNYSKVNLFLKGFVGKISKVIITVVFLSEKNTSQEYILSKINEKSRVYLLLHLYKNVSSLGPEQNTDGIKTILRFADKFLTTSKDQFTSKMLEKLPVEMGFELWINNNVKQLTPKLKQYIVCSFAEWGDNKREEVIKKCSPDEQNHILRQLCDSTEVILDQESFNYVVSLIELVKKFNPSYYDEYLAICYQRCELPLYQLQFWIKGYLDQINVEDFIENLIDLNRDDQIRFIKKLFMLANKGKFYLDDTILERIANLPSKIQSTDNGQISVKSLDYSIEIVIRTILEMKRTKKPISQKAIFDIIIDRVSSAEELLQISGFFEECKGRAYPIKDNFISSEDENGNFNFRRTNKPFEYCEGRLFEKDGKVISDNKYGLPFWWCANQQCFQACQDLHLDQSWEEYTLRDFLEILNIRYNHTQYLIFVGLINKINLFLTHLNCRECGRILYPIDQTYYAFWRVNLFRCANENCVVCQRNEKIYISHCINGKCNGVIDSRDSVRCQPDGFEGSDCGWYVCTSCYGCCSTEKINNRIEKMGSQYNCHTVGHKDIGIICCYKCGTAMIDACSEYNKAREWFINHKNDRKLIVKYGQRDDGRNWYLFKRPPSKTQSQYIQGLRKLKKIGFSIPEIEDSKEIHLVGEAFDYLEYKFICPNCDHILNISELWNAKDFAKLTPLKYHKPIAIAIDTLQSMKRHGDG